MAISRNYELKMKKNVVKLYKEAIYIYENLIKSVKLNDAKYLNKVFIAEKEFNENNGEIIDEIVNGFLRAPLGKDLRRNISYLMISKSIKDVVNKASNLSVYVANAEELKVKVKWIEEASLKLISRLKQGIWLLDNESIEEAEKLYERDKSINAQYKKLISEITKNTETTKQLTKKEKDFIISGFIIAIKNFELAGDATKAIAEAMIFISTAKII